MDPPPARRKIVGAIQRTTTTASSSPTPSSSASTTTSARPVRPPLASSSSPVSSTSIHRSRTAVGLSSGTTVKARVKASNVASIATDGPSLAPPLPLSPSSAHSWTDAGGSDVGSSVGAGTGTSSNGRRAPSPASSFAGGISRPTAASSPRVLGAGGSGPSSISRPTQVHARSSPATSSLRQGQAGPSRHARSNSAGLNGFQPPPLLSPPARSVATHAPFAPAAPTSSALDPPTASVRSSTAVFRAPPASSAPCTPSSASQQQHRSVAPPGNLSPPAPAGAESPPKYFNQLRASVPQDRYLSYSPPPSLTPLPPPPRSPGAVPVVDPTTAMTPDRLNGTLQARRSSASSSFSSSDSPDSRFSGSTTSQPASTSSISSVSFNPPSSFSDGAQLSVSPGFQHSLPPIPSSSCLEVDSRSPQGTIKPALPEASENSSLEVELEDLTGKQEQEDAKVNRKIADLEISNASLLAINHSLEAAKAKQAREIRDLRRRFRSGNSLPPPLKRSSSSRYSLGRSRSPSHSSSDGGDNGEGRPASDDSESDEDDPQFERMKELMLSMLEKGMGALAVKVPEPSGWGVGAGGGGRVLGILEMGEWREKEGGREDEDDSPSPRPEEVVVPDEVPEGAD